MTSFSSLALPVAHYATNSDVHALGKKSVCCLHMHLFKPSSHGITVYTQLKSVDVCSHGITACSQLKPVYIWSTNLFSCTRRRSMSLALLAVLAFSAPAPRTPSRVCILRLCSRASLERMYCQLMFMSSQLCTTSLSRSSA